MLNKRLKNHLGHNIESLQMASQMPDDHQEYLADKYDKFNEQIYLKIYLEIHEHPEKTPRQVIKEWINATDAPHTPRQIKYILEEYEKRRSAHYFEILTLDKNL